MVFTTLGHAAYKQYAIEKRLQFLLVAIILFVGAPISSYLAIKTGLSVAQVYMSTAFVPVLVLFVGRYWFGESVGLNHGIGVGLVVAGTGMFFY